jgi:hypothetical protein
MVKCVMFPLLHRINHQRKHADLGEKYTKQTNLSFEDFDRRVTPS